MTIDLVVPSYRNADLLRSVLDSIGLQTYSDYRVTIVDDSPDDSVSRTALTYCADPRYSYHHNQPSLGAVPNWNHGLHLAASRPDCTALILMHHDEAFADADSLASIARELTAGADAVVSNKRVILPGGIKREKFNRFIKSAFVRMPRLLLGLNAIGPTACVAFRRELLEDFDERLHWLVDMDWYYRVLRRAHNRTYLHRVNIVSHHGHQGQITSSLDIKANDRADRATLRSKYTSPLTRLIIR